MKLSEQFLRELLAAMAVPFRYTAPASQEFGGKVYVMFTGGKIPAGQVVVLHG
jgi:hypothetical protein